MWIMLQKLFGAILWGFFSFFWAFSTLKSVNHWLYLFWRRLLQSHTGYFAACYADKETSPMFQLAQGWIDEEKDRQTDGQTDWLRKRGRETERSMRGAALKDPHLFSISRNEAWNQIRAIPLEEKIGTQHRLPPLPHPQHHPILRLTKIIFSFTGKEHVWSPLLLETRVASEVPLPLRFSPLSPSVPFRCPTLSRMAQGEGRGKRPRAPGLRCGIRCQSGLDSSIWRVILCSEIGFPQWSRSPPWSIRQVTRLH